LNRVIDQAVLLRPVNITISAPASIPRQKNTPALASIRRQRNFLLNENMTVIPTILNMNIALNMIVIINLRPAVLVNMIEVMMKK
jgi:hypothetical protein